MHFVKKLVVALPKKRLTFDAGKGKVYEKRGPQSKLLLIVKDPFMKEMVHSVNMRNKEYLKNLVHSLTLFMKAAVRCKTDEFLLDDEASESVPSPPSTTSNLSMPLPETVVQHQGNFFKIS